MEHNSWIQEESQTDYIMYIIASNEEETKQSWIKTQSPKSYHLWFTALTNMMRRPSASCWVSTTGSRGCLESRAQRTRCVLRGRPQLFTYYVHTNMMFPNFIVPQFHEPVLGLDLPFLPDEVRNLLQLETEDQLQPLILAHGVWHPKIPQMAFAPWLEPWAGWFLWTTLAWLTGEAGQNTRFLTNMARNMAYDTGYSNSLQNVIVY